MDGDWTKLFIQLGAMGLVSWVVVHLFRTTLPEMTKAHLGAITELVAAFREERADRQRYFEALQGEIRRVGHNIVAVRDRGCARGPFPQDQEKT